MTPPVALTVAGVDPSGGAGTTADLSTFAAFGVHGMSVVTALTAQNTTGVQGVAVTDVAFVEDQLDSVLSDIQPDAVKTGMLASEAVIAAVSERATEGQFTNLVVDPVLVASTGARLFQSGAESAYRRLLPFARVATPNLREASVLIERELTSIDEVTSATSELLELGAEVLVVTGGHLQGDAVDMVLIAGEWIELPAERIATDNDHGTGCTFAAATAARLAHGDAPLDAVEAAKRFVHRQLRISARWQLGHGRGPVAHVARPLAD